MSQVKVASWIDEILDTTEADVEEIKNRFAEAVEGILIETGTNRKEFAEKLEVSTPYVTKVLRGDQNLSLKSMAKIARALDCKLDMSLRYKSELNFSSTVMSFYEALENKIKESRTVRIYSGHRMDHCSPTSSVATCANDHVEIQKWANL